MARRLFELGSRLADHVDRLLLEVMHRPVIWQWDGPARNPANGTPGDTLP